MSDSVFQLPFAAVIVSQTGIAPIVKKPEYQHEKSVLNLMLECFCIYGKNNLTLLRITESGVIMVDSVQEILKRIYGEQICNQNNDGPLITLDQISTLASLTQASLSFP